MDNKCGVIFPLPTCVKEFAGNAVAQANENPNDGKSADLVVETILKITDHGLDYLYLHPLDLAQVGLIGKNTVKFGVNTAKKGISIAVKAIIGTLRGEKLKAIAGFIETIIV
ncbi:MAG: hypothetical protein HQK79_11030 [Desulfobacterales bacterium]|nr:hypothetical protein [Desulfobacterales bacterium]MBF0396951.1 hypothetical protein [Desulfobacterales bacterium]